MSTLFSSHPLLLFLFPFISCFCFFIALYTKQYRDLSYNKIASLGDDNVQYFRQQSNLIDLLLNHNDIEVIGESSFHGLVSLQVLDLENNRIKSIHDKAFESLTELRDL